MSKLRVNEIAPSSGVSVGIGTSTPHASALFEMQSTTQGITIPAMTSTQRDAIASPKQGLMINNTTNSRVEMFLGIGWFGANGFAKVVTVAAAGGDFMSIKDAADSITDASATNAYLIEVAPGLYIEEEITIPSYVSIRGASYASTIVKPVAAAQHLFRMSGVTELSFMTLNGHASSLGSGYAAVYVVDVDDYAQLHKISINNFDIGIRNLANTTDSLFYAEYTDIGGDYTYAVHNTSVSSHVAKCQLENFYTYESTSATKTAVLSEGVGADLEILAAGLIGTTGALGVVLKNGGYASIASTFFQGFGTAAVRTENVGAAMTLEISSASFKDCTKNLLIEHVGTAGYFAGYTESAKADIALGATFFLTNRDVTDIFLRTGTVAMTGNMDMGGHNITNVGTVGSCLTALTGDGTTAAGPGSVAFTLATVATPGTHTKVTYNNKGLVTSGADATTSDIAEGSHLYYTEGRVSANTDVAANTAARHAAATIGTANGLSISGQAISLAAATSSVPGALTAADWTTFNNKVSGPGTSDVFGLALFADATGKVLTSSKRGQLVFAEDDFFIGDASSTGEFRYFNSGAGSNVISLTNSAALAGHPGINGLRTGTDTGGFAFYYHGGNTIAFGSGVRYVIENIIYIPVALSDMTDTYQVYAGFNDTITGPATDGAYFEYNIANNAVNFSAVTANNGTRTLQDTGIAVATGTWYKLTVLHDGTSAYFYINDVLTNTISTNLPSGGARATSYALCISKTAGTTSRDLYIDYTAHGAYFPTAR